MLDEPGAGGDEGEAGARPEHGDGALVRVDGEGLGEALRLLEGDEGEVRAPEGQGGVRHPEHEHEGDLGLHRRLGREEEALDGLAVELGDLLEDPGHELLEERLGVLDVGHLELRLRRHEAVPHGPREGREVRLPDEGRRPHEVAPRDRELAHGSSS